MAAIADDRSSARVFAFANGPGRTSKTTLCSRLISLRGQSKDVFAVAYTGIVAALLEGDRTVHSIFGPTICGQRCNSFISRATCAQMVTSPCFVYRGLLVNFVFPGIMSLRKMNNYARKVILRSTNERCRLMNDTVFRDRLDLKVS